MFNTSIWCVASFGSLCGFHGIRPTIPKSIKPTRPSFHNFYWTDAKTIAKICTCTGCCRMLFWRTSTAQKIQKMKKYEHDFHQKSWTIRTTVHMKCVKHCETREPRWFHKALRSTSRTRRFPAWTLKNPSKNNKYIPFLRKNNKKPGQSGEFDPIWSLLLATYVQFISTLFAESQRWVL